MTSQQAYTPQQFMSASCKAHFEEMLERFEKHEFVARPDAKDESMVVYEIDYYGWGLNLLETFCEGEFTFAQRLKFKRYYKPQTTGTDPPLNVFLTEIVDVTQTNHKGSICVVHGFAQCSDAFFEMALHLALNGFHVFMVDLEGHGFSGGTRIVQLSVEQFHHSVSVLMEQVPEDLPCFLYGHSMGGLTVNTYLGLNPKIADRLAGVIYSAPFFGFPAHLNFDFAKKTMMSLGANVLGEFVLCPPNPLHKVCSSKVYQRVILNDRKSNPFFAMKLASSFVRNIDIVGNYAHEIRYPYQLMVAEKDHIVCTKSALKWHEKTKSKDKNLRQIPGAYHELTKEASNHKVFDTMLQFMKKRLNAAEVKAFGAKLQAKDVKYAQNRSIFQRRKFWIILSIFYLLIGAVLAIVRGQKKYFISWPAFLVLAKRLR